MGNGTTVNNRTAAFRKCYSTCCHFNNAFEVEYVRTAFLKKALKICLDSLDYRDDNEIDNKHRGHKKKSRLEGGDHTASVEVHDLFWTCFEDTANEGPNSRQTSDGPKKSTMVELDHYLSMSRVGRVINSYTLFGI